MRIGDSNTSVWYEDSDLWQNGSWARNGLATLLTEEITTSINNIHVPNFSSEDVDSWAWTDSGDGKYTAKKGYDWLLLQEAIQIGRGGGFGEFKLQQRCVSLRG
ncbi:putative ribonuclease H protein [Sesbania bispinosa]|nr:putative ribonuclease H protein [Sesbania bispinosa]